MINLNFRSRLSSIRGRRVVRGVCFGVMLCLATPVYVVAEKPSRIDTAFAMLSNWFNRMIDNNFVVDRMYSKGVLGIPLLNSNNMVITYPKTGVIYLGYLSDGEPENVTLSNCSSELISSEPIQTEKEGIVYYKMVKFEDCRFKKGGVYNITLDSITRRFTIAKNARGCLTKGRYKKFLEESRSNEKSYDEFGKFIFEITWLLKNSSSQCAFEVYQKVVTHKENDRFDKNALEKVERGLAANFINFQPVDNNLQPK